jgi:hypothetical protein
MESNFFRSTEGETRRNRIRNEILEELEFRIC